MNRDELMERVTYVVPGYVVPSDVAEAILELIENELRLRNITPPWHPDAGHDYMTREEKWIANPEWCGMTHHHVSCDCGGMGGDR